MSARGSDFERTLGALLALDVGEVGQNAPRALQPRLRPRQRLQSLEVIDEREEMRRCQDVNVLTSPRRLRSAARRTDQPLAHGVGADGGGQGPGNGADRAVERQFADRRIAGDGVGGDRFHGHHHGQKYGQVELAAFLWQVGGGEVHRHMLVGQPEANGVQRVAYALGAFRHRLVG